MIPYFSFETIDLGFLKIQVWGLMVSLAFLAAILISHIRAKEKKEIIIDLSFYGVLFSLIGARIFHILFYDPLYFLNHPFDILKIWQGGLSILGGILGAILAAIIYLRYHKLNFWFWSDLIVFSLPLGIFIGRLGCFFTHLHPGIKTDFFLGVDYPGGIRHDLGLYLSLNALILFIFFLIFNKYKKNIFSGFYTSFFFLYYGFTRFALDFLRAWDLPVSDARYFYLTPAQYGSAVFIILGVYFLLKLRKI